MRSELQVSLAIEKYADLVKRICMLNLKNYADTEDIFQTVFLKYAMSSIDFENDSHEKAWFIRVAMNASRDLLKNFFRCKTVSIEEVLESSLPSYDSIDCKYKEVLEVVLNLPAKYRDVIYLHYYEGYTAPEIAKILKKNVNTIYTNLTRARKLLRDDLGGMMDE